MKIHPVEATSCSVWTDGHRDMMKSTVCFSQFCARS